MAVRKVVHGIERPQTTHDGGVNWDNDPTPLMCEVFTKMQPEGEVPVMKIPCAVELTADEAREIVKSLEQMEETIAMGQ